MVQRSISSFFFKGAVPAGAGAPAAAVVTDPAPPAPVSSDTPRAPVDTLKRKRADARALDGRREASGAATFRRSDAREVSATRGEGDAASSPETVSDDNVVDAPGRRESTLETDATLLEDDGPERLDASWESASVVPRRDPHRRARLLEKLGEDARDARSKVRDVRERFKWLEAKHAVDENGRTPSDERYDERTFGIPEDAYGALSKSQKQYWDVKKKYRDVVLFFKVGTFYELYEDDAEIGCRELEWKMTVSGVGHCRQAGCPESGVDAAVAELVAKGYRVGRIEQMETAAQAKERTGNKTAVIRRELVEIVSPSTIVDGDLIMETSSRASSKRVGDAATSRRNPRCSNEDVPAHLLAIAENQNRERFPSGDESEIFVVGFAYLDAAGGNVRFGSFEDDPSRVALRAFLTRVAPAEVLARRGELRSGDEFRSRLANTESAPRIVSLPCDGVSAEFPRDGVSANAAIEAFFGSLPREFESAHEQTLCAVAGLVAHLVRVRSAAPLLAARREACVASRGTLRLDGAAAVNLELLRGSDGDREGGLLGKLDSCVTPGGSRTLRRWVLAPLFGIRAIEERQDAVAYFGGFASPDASDAIGLDAIDALRRALRRVPDLERCVGRARAASAARKVDPRAFTVQIAAAKHSRRIAALASALVAAEAVVAALRDIEAHESFRTHAPELVRRSVLVASEETLRGGASAALEAVRAALDFGSTKGSSAASKSPALRSTRVPETQARYASSITCALEVLAEAESECDALLLTFLDHAAAWNAIASAAARLDALASLASFSATASGPTCRPSFVARRGDDAPTFEAHALWHPCAVAQFGPGVRSSAGGCFAVVPNDVVLGGGAAASASPPALLLTGPNMGGKSTLLRAVCVSTVLAQMGAPVPARRMRLSPCDAVFARLGGAGDRLDAGESTFLVECAEAASVLRGATRDSLVVLDELGRGTSTFDGYAVAYASFASLAHRVGCRLMFATHYHALSREFRRSPAARLGHMAAEVTESEEDAGGAGEAVGPDRLDRAARKRSIVFLYELRAGSCPKSHGTNVAGLAGIPEKILVRAENVAAAMEKKLSGVFGNAERRGAGAGALTAGEVEALRRTVFRAGAAHLDFTGLEKLWSRLRETRDSVW